MQIISEFTNVFRRNLEAFLESGYNILFNQGGTGSSKTISIAQLLIYLVHNEIIKNFDIVITRKTTPALKLTVLKDFLDILKKLQLFNENDYSITDKIYHLKTCNFIFCSLDDPEKAKGMKKQLLWMNEANEFEYEDFKQFNMRNDGKAFIDFNPSDDFHWLYEKILPRKDCKFIQSTWRDNPFLSQRKIDEIESYKLDDENYYNIYSLGLRGKTKVKIYNNWDTYKILPDKIEQTIYGIDFGYTHYFGLAEINICENDVYVKHLIFETGLLNSEAIKKANKLNIDKSNSIYCDSARPDLIKEWQKAGFNVFEADKSVEDGIDFVKRFKIHIQTDDIIPIKQWQSYQYKTDKSGEILNDKSPVKKNDDSLDLVRYALYTDSKQYEPSIYGL